MFGEIELSRPFVNREADELETLTDKWLYFLKEANRLESIPVSLEREPAIQNAFEVARQRLLTREEMEILDDQSMLIHDSRNSVLLGQAQGRAEGRAEGEQIGIERGQRLANLAVARSLLGKLPLAEIAPVTGLSLGAIAALESDPASP